ncbi:MAG: hypothetical protein KGO51_07620 [Alphaproteobacteria bacterium]|nr:hypothetical protein [Alphaproteobacteria bacterium]
MDPVPLIAIGVIVLLAIAAVVYMQRRSRSLRERFGPEYGRAVEETGGRLKAEAELRQREKRIEKLDIRPLDPADRSRLIARWRDVQAQFVDDPGAAITAADRLLGEVMAKRGYPVVDFEQRAADLSVEHPEVVENYRAAHDIALRHERGQADTEDLRQAMIHCKTLFEDLVGLPDGRDRGEPLRAERRPRA